MSAAIPFGRYQLLRPLAAGGMAEVFLAKITADAGFEKICVVKRVLPHLATDERFVRMFLDEARLAARLNHPGIVQIFDLGQVNGSYFIAMEYLAGEDLSRVRSRAASLGRTLPVSVCVRVAALAADALHFAHELRDERGEPMEIVHRDVSPSNILVTYQGAVKLLDFGVARARNTLRTTETGQVKGKLAYMSPEQALGHPVDRRCDIWAMGATLHELVTGRRLFDGDGPAAVAHAIVASPIPAPSVLRPGVPPELDRIVLRALARDLDERYATADQLRRDLERFAAELTEAPGLTRLDEFMVELFGPVHASEQVGLATVQGHDATQTGPPLTDRLPQAALEPPSGTVTSAERPSVRRRQHTGWKVAAAAMLGVLVLLVGGFWALRGPRGERAPAPVVPATSSVPAPVPGPTLAPRAPPETTRVPPPIAAAPPVRETTPVAPPATSPRARASATARRGFLDVESNAPVNVWLGSVRLGKAPLRHASVPVGRHLLRVENAQLGLSKEIPIRVEPDGIVHQDLTFGRGKLNVSVAPWADVWLDGKAVGQTPLQLAEVWEGKHLLRLSSPAGTKQVKVDVTTGQTTIVRERLP